MNWPAQAMRAWVRLPSGRRLDLISPTPFDWTDEDLAIGLSRTFRWGGHSTWPAPLSVAQHSLAVLALRRARARAGLTRAELRRELLHDAEEGLLGFDCISPLKPFLGEGFAALSARLAAAVALRYALPAWSVEAKRAHKACDIALAAAEAVHVAGWTRGGGARDARHPRGGHGGGPAGSDLRRPALAALAAGTRGGAVPCGSGRFAGRDRGAIKGIYRRSLSVRPGTC